jgi:VCBS repeat-containing protein
LANDSDADGDLFTAVLSSTTTSGVLSLSGDGSFTYDPIADRCGVDSFGYYADDGVLTSSVATVTINIVCVNDAPIIDAATGDVDEDATTGTVVITFS